MDLEWEDYAWAGRKEKGIIGQLNFAVYLSNSGSWSPALKPRRKEASCIVVPSSKIRSLAKE